MHTPQESVRFRRGLRRTPTRAEDAVWRALRARQHGAKWRRQHPCGPYVLDLYCPASRVAVELDGETHYETPERRARDAERDAYVRRRGIRVLRFTNDEVARQLDAVLEVIWAAVHEAQRPPSP